MAVAEFQIRAWQADSAHVQVLVHTSPAGETRKPVTTPCDLADLEATRELFRGDWFVTPSVRSRTVAVGQRLAQTLFPPEIYQLLTASLAEVPADEVLRVRLCLDERLIDLPWEYLWRPDISDPTSLAGFLLTDSRISLVREAPRPSRNASSPEGRQRMVFVGALVHSGQDWWGVKAEYVDISAALSEISDIVDLRPFMSAAGDAIERALLQPAGILHYSGHTDRTTDGRPYLVREITGTPNRPSYVPLYADQLAEFLPRARTRLACFSACNSGRWGFAKPLLAAGLPLVVGAQGQTSTQGATTFFAKLYGLLAAGLSFDEAVTGARLHVLNTAGFTDDASLEWGNFMVYMTATDLILLPQPADLADAQQRQETARADRRQTFTAVAEGINERALRKAILEKFDLDGLRLLCADIQQDLKDAGITLSVSVDVVGGTGQEVIIYNLIEYLKQRGYLSYLINAVRRARPGII